MKTTKGFIAVLFAGLIVLAGCTPYPEGPDFSLISKTKRIAGTWKIEKATNENGEDATTEFESWRYTFSEDGAAVLNLSQQGVAVEFTGEWKLSEDEANFEVHLSGKLLGFPYEQSDEFVIRRLTDKEFWLSSTTNEKETVDLAPF